MRRHYNDDDERSNNAINVTNRRIKIKMDVFGNERVQFVDILLVFFLLLGKLYSWIVSAADDKFCRPIDMFTSLHRIFI